MIGPMVFIELKKAYDRVASQLVSQTLKKKSIPKGYIDIIRYAHKGALTSMRTVYRQHPSSPLELFCTKGSL